MSAAVYAGRAWLVTLAFGAGYLRSVASLKILALAVPLLFLNMGLTTILIARDLERRNLLCAIFRLVVTAGTNLVLIPRRGGPGAAWATLLTELVLTVCCLVVLRFGRFQQDGVLRRRIALGPGDGQPHNVRVPPEPSRAQPIDLGRVSAYYDAFAEVAQARYTENHILVRVRATFRRAVERYPASAMLDLGCGPGTDLAYFAQLYPGRRYVGVDVSERMVEVARGNLAAVPGARLERGCAADLPRLLGGERFDVIYSFFGPLNTEPDLGEAARVLAEVVAPGGVLVLTFVNRLYALDSALHLLRGRPGRAVARLSDRWRGYSDDKPLDARLYFPNQIRDAFAPRFEVERREGLSIVYPAWYRAHRFARDGALVRGMWLCDRLLNRTPLWCAGEHLLYALRAR